MARAPYLVAVEITWCDMNGELYQKNIDLAEVGGLWWDSKWDPKEPSKGAKRKIPGHKHAKSIGKCAAPNPHADSSCWWDGSEWICPDDFD